MRILVASRNTDCASGVPKCFDDVANRVCLRPYSQGSLADHVDRKALLASGCMVWSIATFATGQADGYVELCFSRALYAIGQSVQNPVAYAMIPELFPRTKASAMAIYNLAIHAGRAVSFASGSFLGVELPDIVHRASAGLKGGAVAANAFLESTQGDDTAATAAATAVNNIVTMPDGVITLPLDQLSDLASLGAHTILYMTGDMIVLAPSAAMDVLGDAALKLGLTWRDIFTVVAAPGLLLVPLLLLTVSDPGRRFTGSRMMRRKARASAVKERWKKMDVTTDSDMQTEEKDKHQGSVNVKMLPIRTESEKEFSSSEERAPTKEFAVSPSAGHRGVVEMVAGRGVEVG